MKPTLLFVFAAIIASTIATTSSAQIVQAGFKAGPQISWFKSDAFTKNTDVYSRPVVGFNAGAVIDFKVRDRFFLNTELIYSQKGKTVTGKKDPNLKDEVTYNHIDLPVLFAIHFKGHMNAREFKWYLNAGPNTSYWLGGHGTVRSGDMIENGLDKIDYKIKFGTRPDNNDADILYIRDARRLQFGLAAGGGILVEPNRTNRLLVDIRYEAGSTQLGNAQSSQFIIPSDYQDNLKGRNMGIRLSVIYLFEFSTAAKDLNKGKSATKARS